MAHIRQSQPDHGLGFQVKVLERLEVVLFSLGSGATPPRQPPRASGLAHCALAREREREREGEREGNKHTHTHTYI